jgi:hypothetical protein
MVRLSGDEPRSVRAMLEYCYTNNYCSGRAPTSEFLKKLPNDVRLLKACETLLLHLHVMIVADKYMVEGLEDEAFDRFKTTLVQNDDFRVHASIVEYVYLAYDPAQDDDMSFLAWMRESITAFIHRMWLRVKARLFGLRLRSISGSLSPAPPLSRVKNFLLEWAALQCYRGAPEQNFAKVTSISRRVSAFGVDLLEYVLTKNTPLSPTRL